MLLLTQMPEGRDMTFVFTISLGIFGGSHPQTLRKHTENGSDPLTGCIWLGIGQRSYSSRPKAQGAGFVLVIDSGPAGGSWLS
jgi:hypothetical protein